MFQHEKPIYPIGEALEILNIKRSHGYHEMKCGRLEFVKNGRRTQVTASGIDRYIKLLEKETQERKARG